MALVVKSAGYQEDENGDDHYLIVLWAQTKDDVPMFKYGDIWNETPMTLTVNKSDKSRPHQS